ncbi:MAG: T9SS type A sorting domain-containing protein [Saprospiraceae bacterium]|nr:T9SS type A sorting domain-containing protein [Saprospiraceae bacterium]MBP8892553.1 T9SS type A sorting domain-containing protein [Saprospiraceae bacterium]MBP9209892.1 T9SS type A sorting domain-containing protein [Saprospiraceae bacterium]MBV6472718.1 hypothetical protein [Saprospiraceae bacterium]
MKKLVIIIILFICDTTAFVQSFSVLEESGQNSAYSVLPTDDGYVFIVNNMCDSVCNSIYKIGFDSTLIYKREQNGFSGKLYKSSRPTIEYLIFGIYIVGGKYGTILREMDTEGNIKNTFKFEYPDANIFGNQVIDDGSGYIINSTKFQSNPPIDTAYIFKIDYSGGLIWEDKICLENNSTYLVNNPVEMTKFSSNEYAIVGKYKYFVAGSIFPCEKSFLIRFNENGKISYYGSFDEFRRHLFSSDRDSCNFSTMVHFTCAGNDSSYIVTARFDSLINFPGKDSAYRHAFLIHLDKANNPIKYTLIPNYIDAKTGIKILKCKNNDIIYMDDAGDRVVYPNYAPGFRLSRVNVIGELLWQRTYVTPYFKLSDSSLINLFTFYDFAELNDKSLIIIGAYKRYLGSNDNFDQDAFVMILDSLGCFDIDCELYSNVFKLTHKVGVDNVGKSDIKIYPNPANDWLRINLDNVIENYFKIDVYDLIGRKILSAIDYYLNTEGYQLDISKLKSGIYCLKIYDGNKHISNKMFIINNDN